MAEIWGAAIAAAGAIGGGLLASQGAKDAGNKSAAGSAAAIAEQQRQYDTTRADTAPYRTIGSQAINALGSIYGYKPAATPQSFEQWAAANPVPQDLSKYKPGGPGSTSVISALDPLGVVSGGGTSARRILDPIGIFGSHDSKPKAPDPATVQRTAYQQYLQNFDYNGGGAPAGGNALAPKGGYDPSTGYIVDGSGGIKQGIAGGSGGGMPVGGSDTPGVAAPDYSNFFASPDYQFRRDEGIRGVERSAAAGGLIGSGNALAALAERNSNIAAGEFGNYFNRQAALAGIGQTATNTATTAGMNAANNTAGYLQSAADARASGIADSANAWGNALGTVAGIAYDRWGRPKKTVGG